MSLLVLLSGPAAPAVGFRSLALLELGGIAADPYVPPSLGFTSLALLDIGGISAPPVAGGRVHLTRGLAASPLVETRLIA